MKKKSLITMLVSLSLVAVVGVGATLAYLSDSTQTLNNTFTVGADIDISLVEHVGSATGTEDLDGIAFTDLQPGDVLYKDPTVTVTKGSTASRVFIKVVGIDALEAIDTNGSTVAGTDFSVTGFDSAQWLKVAQADKSVPANATKDGIYQYVGTTDRIVAKTDPVTGVDTKLPALFTTVTYNTTAQQTSTPLPITVTACAIQSDNLNDAQSLTEAIFN